MVAVNVTQTMFFKYTCIPLVPLSTPLKVGHSVHSEIHFLLLHSSIWLWEWYVELEDIKIDPIST